MQQIYPYEDADGEPLFRVKRFGNKNFSHEHPTDGNGSWVKGRGSAALVPYRLPEVLAAIDAGDPVYVCEGEKDCETARLQGVVATTNSGGAGKWRDEHSKWLKAAEPVIIIWDNDDEGRRHALAVETSLRKAGVQDIRMRRAAVGKDLTDHIEAGKTLRTLAKKRPTQPVVVDEEDEDDDDDKRTPAAFQLALTRLRDFGTVTKEEGPGKVNQYNAHCPAHDDNRPSLSIRPGEDVAVLVTCHANGCTPAQIARALDINPVEFTRVPTKELDDQARENERAYMRKLANQHADQRLMQERSLSTVKFKGDSATLEDELAKPQTVTKWLIDSWFRASTAVLLNADPKAGKTRLALNLMKSLSENEPFLGRFQTNQPEDTRIWYGNWDQPEDLMLDYCHDYEWLASDRCILKNLGSMEFPFWVPSVFDDFVEYAHDMRIGTMIVDTLHVASQGFVENENDNNEMSAFIHLMRKLVRAAEIPNLAVIHHTGHGQERRGRGASTLAADFDGMWFLHQTDPEQFDAPRELSAKGRKLGVNPIELVYDLATESYSYAGALPGKAGSDSVDPDLMVEYLNYVDRLREYNRKNGEWPPLKVARKMTGKKTSAVTAFMRAMSALGLIERVPDGKLTRVQAVLRTK